MCPNGLYTPVFEHEETHGGFAATLPPLSRAMPMSCNGLFASGAEVSSTAAHDQDGFFKNFEIRANSLAVLHLKRNLQYRDRVGT